MTAKPLGRLALSVAVAATVGFAASSWTRSSSYPRQGKTVVWEPLEGRDGSDLLRTRTPSGWLVESPEGFLVQVIDLEHEWLNDQ
jgi:hypothetical protein